MCPETKNTKAQAACQGHTADCPDFETRYPWQCCCRSLALPIGQAPEGKGWIVKTTNSDITSWVRSGEESAR